VEQRTIKTSQEAVQKYDKIQLTKSVKWNYCPLSKNSPKSKSKSSKNLKPRKIATWNPNGRTENTDLQKFGNGIRENRIGKIVTSFSYSGYMWSETQKSFKMSTLRSNRISILLCRDTGGKNVHLEPMTGFVELSVRWFNQLNIHPSNITYVFDLVTDTHILLC
jgi:hypothetical protein